MVFSGIKIDDSFGITGMVLVIFSRPKIMFIFVEWLLSIKWI